MSNHISALDPQPQRLQDGIKKTDNGTVFNLGGKYGSLTLQITGITSATITFEASLDGTNYGSIVGNNIATNAQAATATANGVYQFNVVGIKYFRARVSTYVSGTIYVDGMAVPEALAPIPSTNVQLTAGTALAGKFVPVDADGDEKFTAGNPAVMQLSGSILAKEKNKVVLANTDILTDYTAIPTMQTTLMVETTTGGTLSLEVDGVLASLNGGVALDTGKWYAFDIPVLAASVYNLQFSAGATMQINWIGGF